MSTDPPFSYRSPASHVDTALAELENRVRALVQASVAADFGRETARSLVSEVQQATKVLAKSVRACHVAMNVEERQIDQILDVLSGLAAMDFDRRVTVHGDSGKIDAVAMLTNMLSEELAASQRALADRSVALSRAKDAAEAATAAKSQFLANMSHEIRTPLTALLGFADLLGAPELTERDRLGYAQVIRRNGEHLLSLMNDILDLSKIEAGRLELAREDCSVADVLSGVVSLMRVRASEQGLDFGLYLVTPVPAVVRTDPVRLRQILLNLVGNAIKFTERGSVRILVRYEPKLTPPRLSIDVVDTGIGMNAAHLAQIFRPFQQVDPSMTRRYGGTGLGLAICRPLAEALGGSISASSVLGEGSTFTLTLAVVVPPATPLVQSIAEHAAARAQGGPPSAWEKFEGSVLLAEDGPDNQLLVTTILRGHGLAVEVAENGQEALTRALSAQAAGKPFDLILMDMQMPVLDGYAATTDLRRRGYKRPIVALTAHAMTGERERCLAAGCDDYLPKPIDRAALAALLAVHVRRRATDAPPSIHSTATDDPEIKDLIPRFVASLGARAAALRETAERDDIVGLKRLAHQLKGAAGGYGFASIGAAAADLERAVAESPRSADVARRINELIELCARAKV